MNKLSQNFSQQRASAKSHTRKVSPTVRQPGNTPLHEFGLPRKLTQVSPQTGGGQRIVEEFAQPTTVIGGGRVVTGGFIAPPSNAAWVLQASEGSEQLKENTETGAGTGHMRVSLPHTKVVKTPTYYFVIGGLGVALLIAFIVDRKK